MYLSVHVLCMSTHGMCSRFKSRKGTYAIPCCALTFSREQNNIITCDMQSLSELATNDIWHKMLQSCSVKPTGKQLPSMSKSVEHNSALIFTQDTVLCHKNRKHVANTWMWQLGYKLLFKNLLNIAFNSIKLKFTSRHGTQMNAKISKLGGRPLEMFSCILE